MADAAVIRQRLTRARAGILRQAELVLDHAIATGRSAKEVARHLASYVSPYFSRRRSETGGLLRATRIGAHPVYPAGAGLASFPARTIAVTEISQAHGVTVRRIAAQRPGWFLRWTLAPGRRQMNDLCDANAKSDQGYGPGIYRGDATPIYPDHPRCRCVLQPIQLPGVA